MHREDCGYFVVLSGLRFKGMSEWNLIPCIPGNQKFSCHQLGVSSYLLGAIFANSCEKFNDVAIVSGRDIFRNERCFHGVLI